MSVVNGQIANQTTFNTAFMSRTSPTTSTVAKVTLSNVGSTAVDDLQKFLNQNADTVGFTENDATRKNYSSNNVVANGDSHKVAMGKLDAAVQQAFDEIDAIFEGDGVFAGNVFAANFIGSNNEQIDSLNDTTSLIGGAFITLSCSVIRLQNPALTLLPAGSFVVPAGLSPYIMVVNDKDTDLEIEGNDSFDWASPLSGSFYTTTGGNLVVPPHGVAFMRYSEAQDLFYVTGGGSFPIIRRSETYIDPTHNTLEYIVSHAGPSQVLLLAAKSGEGAVTMSNFPFGAVSFGNGSGSRITLIGTSDVDYPVFVMNDTGAGMVGAFTTIELKKGVVAEFVRVDDWLGPGGIAVDDSYILVSSPGGGGGAPFVYGAIRVLGAADDLSGEVDANSFDQTFYVQSTGGVVAPLNKVFGDAPGGGDGAIFTVIGTNIDDVVKISYSDTQWGCVGPFSVDDGILLSKYKAVVFKRDDTTERMIWIGGVLA